jgi:recombination protein RecA
MRGLLTVAKNKKSPNGKIEDDFTQELIKEINRSHNDRIAYNLGMDDPPTEVKRWISTGSRQLDFLISNQLNGGLPEGRIVEIQGPASSGKSHIAFEVAKSTQRMGGIVVYIDTENATSLQNLRQLGIDVKRRFVFVQTACTEDIFSVAEETILKARTMTKDVPVTIIWDSVAASSPKAELEGAYDQNTIGLQARVIGKDSRWHVYSLC